MFKWSEIIEQNKENLLKNWKKPLKMRLIPSIYNI